MPAPTASSLAAAADPALPAAFLSLPSPLLPASPPLPAAPAPSSNAFCVPRGPARAVAVSVSVSAYGAGSTAAASRLHRMWAEFSRFVRLHGNQIAPLGFASLGLGVGGGGGGSGEGAGGGGGGGGGEVDGLVEEEGVARAEAPKKVLILMSDTGGGHRASAEAIKAAFIQEFGDDYQVFVTDLWTDHTPWPFNQLPRSYSFLVKHGPLWKMTYYGTAPRRGCKRSHEIPTRCNYQCPSFNAACPTPNPKVKRFHKLVTRCYCPSAEVSKRALKAGLQPSQIKVYGLPVRPSFVKPIRPEDELRRELGMDEYLPAVLLMGGGEGMGPIEATARALGDALYDEVLGEPTGQILVICGRNKKLTSRLQSINWKVPVQVKGFVTKMEECMGACDCIITKAGPGTIAEAMIRGLPIILNGYIAGQEAGNVPYVVDNGCGKFSKSPEQIAKIVADWFGPRSDELKMMSQNALKLARPDAVFKIVHDLHELAHGKRAYDGPHHFLRTESAVAKI
uniref:monogalactosyldiacylglycerol synthase n=2 Tax=Oryza TaxID=4527 RepID=A0A0E0QRK5_ORYRU